MSDTESSSSENEDEPKDPNYVDWRNMENIRVICRFRPINSREIREEKSAQLVDKPPEIVNKGTCIKIHRDTSNRVRTAPLEFYLDKILPSNTSQQNLYLNVGKPMVEACLEGYNTTIFAYGQTGSGKTYTMFGPENQKLKSNNELGCVQRCISFMFTELQQRIDNKSVTEWKVLLHFVQMYREKLLDLLEPDKGIPLKIRYDPRTDSPYVPNLKSVDVSEMLEVMKLLVIANKNRITSKTDMNDVSSRSHMIMTLNIEQTLKDGTVKKSKLNFADLAGSETFQKALGGHGRAVDKKKMEELKTINLSLTSLTTCINYLSKGRIASYRSSQLTFYLMDSLGGNSKTTLVVAASPHIFNRTETISTLRFAKTAKSVKNKAKVNKELSKAQLEKLVKKLQRENKRLKARLALMEAELIKNGIDLPTEAEKKRRNPKRSKSMRAVSTKEVLKVTNEFTQSRKSELQVLNESSVNQISYAGNGSNKRRFGQMDESVYNKLKVELKSLQDEFAQQEIEASILNDQLQKKNQIVNELTEELQSSRNTSSELSTLQEDKQQLEWKLKRKSSDISNMKQQLKTERDTFMSEKGILEQELNESQFDIQQYESIMDDMKLSNEQLVAEVDSLRESITALQQRDKAEKKEKEEQEEDEANKANEILSKYFAVVNKEQMNGTELKDTDKKIESLSQNIVNVTDAYEIFTGQHFSLRADIDDDDAADDDEKIDKNDHKRKRKRKKSSKLQDRLTMFGGASLKRRKSSARNIKAKQYRDSNPKPKNKNLIFQTERLTHYLNGAMNKMAKQKEIYSEDLKCEMKKKDTLINNLCTENKELQAKMDHDLSDKNTEIERLKQELIDLKLEHQTTQLTKHMMDSEDGDDDELFAFNDQLEYLANIANKSYDDTEFDKTAQITQPQAVHNPAQIAQWRHELAIASKMDCLDEACLWWTATVTDSDLYRIKVRYDGFDARWDEWMDRGSTRIAPHLSHAKGGRESKGVAVNLKVVGKKKDKQTGELRRIYKQGFLVKQGARFKSYRTRYFMLLDDGTMEYYKKMTDQTPAGTFNIRNMIETRRIAYPNKKNLYGFEIVTQKRTWRFQAHSDEVVAGWIGVIHAVSKGVTPNDADTVHTVVYSGYDMNGFDADAMNKALQININNNHKKAAASNGHIAFKRSLSIQEESSSHPPINRAAFSQLLDGNEDDASEEEKDNEEMNVNEISISIANALNVQASNNKSRPESPYILTTDEDEEIDLNIIQHSGWMHKAGKWDANWTHRYCVLTEEEEDVTLRCYVAPNKKETHCIYFKHVNSCMELKANNDIYGRLEIPTAFAFQLITATRIYTFACKSKHEANVWFKKIRKVIQPTPGRKGAQFSKRSSFITIGSKINKLGTSFGRLIGVTQEHVTTTEVLKTENVEIQQYENHLDAPHVAATRNACYALNIKGSVNGIANGRRHSQPILSLSHRDQFLAESMSDENNKKGSRRKSAPDLRSFKDKYEIDIDRLIANEQKEKEKVEHHKSVSDVNINENIAAVLKSVEKDFDDNEEESNEEDLSLIE